MFHQNLNIPCRFLIQLFCRFPVSDIRTVFRQLPSVRGSGVRKHRSILSDIEITDPLLLRHTAVRIQKIPFSLPRYPAGLHLPLHGIVPASRDRGTNPTGIRLFPVTIIIPAVFLIHPLSFGVNGKRQTKNKKQKQQKRKDKLSLFPKRKNGACLFLQIAL